jgi:hypothetical protein
MMGLSAENVGGDGAAGDLLNRLELANSHLANSPNILPIVFAPSASSLCVFAFVLTENERE